MRLNLDLGGELQAAGHAADLVGRIFMGGGASVGVRRAARRDGNPWMRAKPAACAPVQAEAPSP
jgi:hypothetical protein